MTTSTRSLNHLSRPSRVLSKRMASATQYKTTPPIDTHHTTTSISQALHVALNCQSPACSSSHLVAYDTRSAADRM